MKRALRRFLKAFLVVLGIMALLAVPVSTAFHLAYLTALVTLLYIGGILLVGASVLTGAGFSELGYIESPLYAMSSTYQEAITSERISRRDDQFESMIVGVLFGVLLIGTGYLASISPLFAAVVVGGVLISVHGFSRPGAPRLPEQAGARR